MYFVLAIRRVLARLLRILLSKENGFAALKNEESSRYLGLPIGLIHNIADIPKIVPRLIRDLEVIRTSFLVMSKVGCYPYFYATMSYVRASGLQPVEEVSP